MHWLNRMFKYTAYDLVIESEIELPELSTIGVGHPDIIIRKGTVERICGPGHGSASRFGREETIFEWATVGRFSIIERTTIVVDANPGVADAIIRMPLLGPVLALTLHANGHLILHASAVALPTGGVVFMGDKGAGKSTTAAMLLSRGHLLLADDIVLITSANEPLIVPGFGQMKLTDESSEIADLKDSELQPQHGVDGLDKRRHLLTKGFAAKSVVPLRLFVLKRGERIDIRRCSSSEALEAILRFSYVARFGKSALGNERAASFLSQCSALASRRLVYELSVPPSLKELRDTIEFIENNAIAH